jgi:hypothetical protein
MIPSTASFCPRPCTLASEITMTTQGIPTIKSLAGAQAAGPLLLPTLLVLALGQVVSAAGRDDKCLWVEARGLGEVQYQTMR